MSTATGTEVRTLAVYDRIADPMAAIKQLGHTIAHSGMFGCETVEQGEVLAMECLWSKVPPLSLKKRHHIIKGQLTDKADWILGEFRKRGGDHRIVERTPDVAIVDLSYGGDTQRFALTWEEAAREPFVYQGKEKDVVAALLAGRKPELKAKYATPRSRMQMLWARVVSDGVRAMRPDIVASVYTPEEVHDFTGSGNTATEVDETCTVVQPTNGKTATTTQPVQDAEFEPKREAGQEHVVELAQDGKIVREEVIQGDGYATAEQVAGIIRLFQELQTPHEAQEKILAKRGVKALRSLKAEQADELIAALEGKLFELQAGGESRANPTALAASNSDPATPVQINQAKQLIAEVAQNGQPDIAKRVKQKLESHGLAKLADLSMAEIGRLHAALSVRNLEAFFASSLAGHQGHQKN